eukprot:5996139-Pleurochrysis_carterae.AAC.1
MGAGAGGTTDEACVAARCCCSINMTCMAATCSCSWRSWRSLYVSGGGAGACIGSGVLKAPME